MSSNSPSLPPPPPPPAPPQKTRVAVPPSCHPKVDALFRLYLNSPFDEREHNRLLSLDTEMGPRFHRILSTCRPYRDKFLVSKDQYQRDKNHNNRNEKSAIGVDQTSKRNLQMDSLQLQSCLAHQACPRRYIAYGKCWSQIPPQLVQEFQHAGLVQYLCQAEREGVERCVGAFVSQAVHTADGGLDLDDGTNMIPT